MNNSYTASVILYIVLYVMTGLIARAALSNISDNRETCQLNGRTIRIDVAIFLVVIIPAVIAGIRYGIGTDYTVTYVKYFDTCRSGLYRGNKYEFLFFALNVIVSYLKGNVNIVLFIAILITLMCYIKGLTYFKNDITMGFSVLVFMFLSYNNMINNTRQWIAVAIIFYGLRFCFERKFVKYLVAVIVAMGFHISAICTLPLYFIVARAKPGQSSKLKKKQSSKTRNIFIIGVLFAIVFVSQFAITAFDSIGLGYYVPYFTRLEYIGYINWLAFVRYLPWVVVILYLMKKEKSNYSIYICALFALLGVITEIVAMHVSIGGFEQIHRMANYFTCYLPVIAGAVFKRTVSEKGRYKIKINLYTFCVILIFFITLVIWINDIVLNNANATLPYVSIFAKK